MIKKTLSLLLVLVLLLSLFPAALASEEPVPADIAVPAADGDIMQFLDQGDTAPNDRFNYRYTTVETEVKLPECLTKDMIVLKAGSYNAFAGGKQVRLDASSTKAVMLGRGGEFYLPKAFVETVIGVSCEGLKTYDHYGITYVMPAEAIATAGKAVTISDDGLVVISSAAVEDKDVLTVLYRALM